MATRRDPSRTRPSLERQCDGLACQIPRPLISDSAWRRVRRLASRLPNAWSSAILECRLAAASERVDLLVCASKWRGDREAIRAALEDDRAGSTWGSARALLEAWSEPGSSWGEAIPLVWLEYDLPDDGEPEPFALFCVDPTYPRAGPTRRLDSARLLSLARLALGAGGDVDTKNGLDTLARCERALPAAGRFLHLGALPVRRGGGLRAVAAMPFGEVPSWLRGIDWPGPREEVARALALVSGRFSRASIQLDLGLAVGARLAVEYQVPTSPSSDPGWQRLIDDLVAIGISTPERGSAARDWIGHDRVELGDVPWSLDLVRQLNVKVVIEPDGRLCAKAYLCFEPRFRLV